AESALKRAALIAAGNQKELAAAAFKVRLRLADDAELAGRVAEQSLAGERDSMDLNNVSWYLMTRRGTMGRFDAFALHLMRKLQEARGGNLGGARLDTRALAQFMNGLTAEAIETETAALAEDRGDPRYEARLARFKRVQERETKKR